MIPVRAATVLTVLAAWMALASCGERQPEWRTLSPADAGFSVLMRADPRYTRQELDTPAGRMSAHLYSSDHPDAYYAVGYSDYPLGLVAGAPPQTLFSGVRDTWVRRINGRLVGSDRPLELAGTYRGFEFTAEGTTRGEPTFVQARVFLVDQRLFQVIAMGRKNAVPQGTVNRFLNSFRLIATQNVGSVKVEPLTK